MEIRRNDSIIMWRWAKYRSIGTSINFDLFCGCDSLVVNVRIDIGLKLMRNMQISISRSSSRFFLMVLENIQPIVSAAWVGRTIVGLGWTGRAVGRGPRPSGFPEGGARRPRGRTGGRVRELPTRVAHVNSPGPCEITAGPAYQGERAISLPGIWMNGDSIGRSTGCCLLVCVVCAGVFSLSSSPIGQARTPRMTTPGRRSLPSLPLSAPSTVPSHRRSLFLSRRWTRRASLRFGSRSPQTPKTPSHHASTIAAAAAAVAAAAVACLLALRCSAIPPPTPTPPILQQPFSLYVLYYIQHDSLNWCIKDFRTSSNCSILIACYKS